MYRKHKLNGEYHIYSINHPECLFNFGPMRVGAYCFPNIVTKLAFEQARGKEEGRGKHARRLSLSEDIFRE